MSLFLKLLLLLQIFHFISPLNILVYSPRFGHSHTNFMSRVADILGEAGHKVTYLEPLFVEKVAAKGPMNRNVQIIEVPRSKFIIHLFTTQKSDSSGSARWETTTLTDFWVTKKYIDLLRVAALDSLERIITDEMMMNRLKALQFDVAITQPVEWSGYGLFYRLGLKKYLTVFSTSPGMTYSTIFGAPYAISYAPAMLSRKNERMSFYDRAINFVYTLMEKLVKRRDFQEELSIRVFGLGKD